MTTLSVNVDHVATIREARGVGYPDPLDAAKLALAAGADGITIHLRGDRRHIQDLDITRLRSASECKLNLEIALTDEMLAIAVAQHPHQVTLVPERPGEITTEGGLDLSSNLSRVEEACRRLQQAGVSSSIFLDPDLEQISLLEGLNLTSLPAIELNTDSYSRSSRREIESSLKRLVSAAEAAVSIGCRLFAGHGLTIENVGRIAALPKIEELNIGHSIVSRSVLVGMRAAVIEMLAAIQKAST